MRTSAAMTAALVLLATAQAHGQTSTTTAQSDKGSAVITRTVDKAAGTVAVDRTVTRASDGATATSSYDRTRTETGHVASGSSTGFKGQTASWDKEVTRGEGTRTVTGASTGPKGNTLDYSSTATRGENGWTSQGNWSTSTGKSGTTSGYARKTETGHERGRAIQNSAGETTGSRDVAVSRVDGQRTKTVATTGKMHPRKATRPNVARPGG